MFLKKPILWYSERSPTHGVCQPGGRAVMTGLDTQWLLIAAQDQSDNPVR